MASILCPFVFSSPQSLSLNVSRRKKCCNCENSEKNHFMSFHVGSKYCLQRLHMYFLPAQPAEAVQILESIDILCPGEIMFSSARHCKTQNVMRTCVLPGDSNDEGGCMSIHQYVDCLRDSTRMCNVQSFLEQLRQSPIEFVTETNISCDVEAMIRQTLAQAIIVWGATCHLSASEKTCSDTCMEFRCR